MTDTKPVIRDYRHGDFPAILAVWEATGLGGAQRGDDAAVIERSLAWGGRFLVLEQPAGGTIVGTAWLTCDARRLYLHHVGVLPSHQRRGFGARLTAEAQAIARERGLQIKLEVHRDNHSARDIYLRAGFARLGEYDVLIDRTTGSPATVAPTPPRPREEDLPEPGPATVHLGPPHPREDT